MSQQPICTSTIPRRTQRSAGQPSTHWSSSAPYPRSRSSASICCHISCISNFLGSGIESPDLRGSYVTPSEFKIPHPGIGGLLFYHRPPCFAMLPIVSSSSCLPSFSLRTMLRTLPSGQHSDVKKGFLTENICAASFEDKGSQRKCCRRTGASQ